METLRTCYTALQHISQAQFGMPAAYLPFHLSSETNLQIYFRKKTLALTSSPAYQGTGHLSQKALFIAAASVPF